VKMRVLVFTLILANTAHKDTNKYVNQHNQSFLTMGDCNLDKPHLASLHEGDTNNWHKAQEGAGETSRRC
jgi:hypothetical protein